MASESAYVMVRVPVGTEALTCNEDMVVGARIDKVEDAETLLIELDVRRRSWRRLLGLPKGTSIHWNNVHTVDVQELSALLYPIRYRVTVGDGWYRDASGKRIYFGVDEHLPGIDLRRGVTTTALRAAVLLAVVGGVGLRQVCWLLKALFQVSTTKSSVDRWIEEAASQLPSPEEIVKALQAQKPITEAHFDEIFPRGRKGPVLVVRDEHGRILHAEEVEHRDEAHVVPFLERLKSWGLLFKTFYIDHCAAYSLAIKVVYADANIQHDFFHILQNIWRKAWKSFVAHRRAVKAQSGSWAGLEAFAERLWEKRYLFFTTDERLDVDQARQVADLVAQDPFVDTMRSFLRRVRSIFVDSDDEAGAIARLADLRRFVTENHSPAFSGTMKFLDGHWAQMVTFLRVPGVRRNSLAETGMRTLRRLEQGHDGFRTPESRDHYLRLFQAIRYLGWPVHRRDGCLGIPTRPSAAAA